MSYVLEWPCVMARKRTRFIVVSLGHFILNIETAGDGVTEKW